MEPRPDGSTKVFSCGHRLHAVSLSETPISVKDTVKTEHLLGPHSRATISHTTDALVVSMQQEMYKDALHFFTEAKKNHATGGDPFATWRNLRAAVLFTFAAIEACINQFIDTHINKNRGLMPQKEIDHWTKKDGHVTISEKLNQGVELYGGTRLDQDAALWQDFKDLKNLRNDLVHYKAENRLFYNTEEFINRIEKGIRTASAIIKRIYLAHPENKAYPPVFDTLP